MKTLKEKIQTIVAEIENYSMRATKDDLKDKLDYDWLAEKREEVWGKLEKLLNN